MRKKLIPKGQAGMASPLTSLSIQEILNYNTTMMKNSPNMQKLQPKGVNIVAPSSQTPVQSGTLANMNTSQPTLSPKGVGIAGVLGSASDKIGAFFPDKRTDTTTQGLNQGHEAVSNVMSSIPTPATQIIGAAMKAQAMSKKAMDNITGGATTLKNPTQGLDKVLDSNWLAGSGVSELNALTKKKVKGSNQDIAKQIDIGYKPTEGIGSTEIGGVTRAVKKLFGKKDPVKERKKIVARIDKENTQKLVGIQSTKQNNILAANVFQDIESKNRQKLTGGLSANIIAAKNGVKLFKEKQKLIEENSNKNVIPEGALHARRHNLPKEISKHVTDKGIPVVTLEDGGLTQHAEIEHSEIIFTKNVTNKLEELLKKYNEGDESSLIEAGKLLTYEILENTEDNVGLLNTIN